MNGARWDYYNKYNDHNYVDNDDDDVNDDDDQLTPITRKLKRTWQGVSPTYMGLECGLHGNTEGCKIYTSITFSFEATCTVNCVFAG